MLLSARGRVGNLSVAPDYNDASAATRNRVLEPLSAINAGALGFNLVDLLKLANHSRDAVLNHGDAGAANTLPILIDQLIDSRHELRLGAPVVQTGWVNAALPSDFPVRQYVLRHEASNLFPPIRPFPGNFLSWHTLEFFLTY